MDERTDDHHASHRAEPAEQRSSQSSKVPLPCASARISETLELWNFHSRSPTAVRLAEPPTAPEGHRTPHPARVCAFNAPTALLGVFSRATARDSRSAAGIRQVRTPDMKEAWPTPKVDQASPPLRSAPLTGTCRAFPDLWRSGVNRATGGVPVLQPHGPRTGDGDGNQMTSAARES